MNRRMRNLGACCFYVFTDWDQPLILSVSVGLEDSLSGQYSFIQFGFAASEGDQHGQAWMSGAHLTKGLSLSDLKCESFTKIGNVTKQKLRDPENVGQITFLFRVPKEHTKCTQDLVSTSKKILQNFECSFHCSMKRQSRQMTYLATPEAAFSSSAISRLPGNAPTRTLTSVFASSIPCTPHPLVS
jgi:hypothetical protein